MQASGFEYITYLEDRARRGRSRKASCDPLPNIFPHLRFSYVMNYPMVTNKKYSNHRILRYIGKSQMGKNGGKRVAACFSAPVPPRSVLQVRNGFETRGQHSSLLPLP